MTAVPLAEEKDITRLLHAWAQGDRSALDRLLPVVYGELRRLARRYTRKERTGHALHTTSLVHEAYLRLVDQRAVRWKNRTHFFAVAAQLMRRILVDHARRSRYAKRGGGFQKVSLDEVAVLSPERAAEVVAVDEALSRLATIDRRKSQVVELRYFGGLTVEEVAQLLDVSPATVMREWRAAKAWLYNNVRKR